MKRYAHMKYHPRVYEEACEWFVEFRSGAPEEAARQAFYSWLQEAPAHMAAYLDVAASWTWSANWDPRGRFSKDSLIAEALRDAQNVRPHPLRSDPPGPSIQQVRRGLRVPAARALIAAGIAAVATVCAIVLWRGANPTYATGIGEQRSILLSDGSTVYLNSRSRIRVHYSDHERDVYLLAGQALFNDIEEANRPFIVRTGAAQVRAIGTKFDVDRRAAETVITVIEGRVAVSELEAIAPSVASARSMPARLATPRLTTIYLAAGEQLAAAPSIEPRPTRVNITNAIAWTRRELVFVSTPLQEVAEEFNRYNRPQLLIADPDLARFQIDGVFSSTDPTSLVTFLRQRLDIKVTRSSSQIVISRH